MNLDGHGHCFRSSCLLPLSFVVHGKVSLWHAVAVFGGTCRSRRDVAGRVFGDHRPVSPGTGGSLFPSVRAIRSDTAAVRLVNVKLGLDSEKKKPTSYPRSLNRETTFGRRNGLRSLHCMHNALKCFARFSVSPTFLRANLWWIAPLDAGKKVLRQWWSLPSPHVKNLKCIANSRLTLLRTPGLIPWLMRPGYQNLFCMLVPASQAIQSYFVAAFVSKSLGSTEILHTLATKVEYRIYHSATVTIFFVFRHIKTPKATRLGEKKIGAKKRFSRSPQAQAVLETMCSRHWMDVFLCNTVG